jgi:hypothetical protein
MGSFSKEAISFEYTGTGADWTMYTSPVNRSETKVTTNGTFTSKTLRVKFGFTDSDLADAAEITGIEIEFKRGMARDSSSSTHVKTNSISLYIGTTNRTLSPTGQHWPSGQSTSATLEYYGGSSNKWGASTITVANITSSNFRCDLTASLVAGLTTGVWGSVLDSDFYCTVYYKEKGRFPIVTNKFPTNISPDSITLNSNLALRDYNRVRNFTWIRRIATGGTNESNNVGIINSSGDKTYNITGLTSNRHYICGGTYSWLSSDVKSSYVGEAGSASFIYGNISGTNTNGHSFITRVWPLIGIADASNITENSARLNLNYFDKGSYNAVMVSWYFRQGTSGTWTLLEKGIRSATGTHYINKTGLLPGTLYQYYCKILRRSIDLYPVGGYIRCEDVLSAGDTKTYEINGKDYEVTNVITGVSGGVKFTRFMINGELTSTMNEDDEYTLFDDTLFHVFLIGSSSVNFFLVQAEFNNSEYQNEENTAVKSFTTLTSGGIYYNISDIFKKINNVYYNIGSSTFKKINSLYYHTGTSGWKKIK